MKRFAAIFTVLAVACGLSVLALSRPPDRPDRSRPPAPGPPPALVLPVVQKGSLSNGIAVWLIEAHEVPIVQVTLVLPVGSSDDPANHYGLASLTAAMLDEGAGTRTALQIADEVEFLGATLGAAASFDATAIRLNVPTARVPDALPIMADVALRPTFPGEELERVREERVTALLQARDDAPSVAAAAFARVVFGSTHRYGTGAIGTPATVKAITNEDLQRFHAAWYQPDGATLIVVGDTSRESILPMLETAFGQWQGSGPPSHVLVPAPEPRSHLEITIVDMPNAEQSQIRIGTIGVARSTPDYFPIEVLNTVLGGSFTSRLNQNLREEHGYTYGASSRFDMRRSAGSFVAGAGVQTDKTADSLREFFAELRGIREPVDAEELTRARNYLALGFPSEFETIRELSGHLEESVVYGLPADYFDRYVGRVEAVTTEDVKAAAAAYIRPDTFAVVVAGDARAIEPGVRALNLGTVRVLTVEQALDQ